MNTSTCAAVAPVRAAPRYIRSGGGGHPPARALLALLAAASIGLAACGGGASPSASSVLRETFSSHRPISSGHVELSLALIPRAGAGARGAGGSSSFRLAGSFQGTGAERLPLLGLALDVAAGGRRHTAGVVSTGGRLYLRLAGETFLAPAAALVALEQGYAQGRSISAPGVGMPSFATLGVEPAAWLTHPSLAGRTRISGAEVFHVVAGLDGARFLADARRLSSAGEALTGGRASSRLARSSSVRSARVDLFTGVHDHLLRRLALTAELAGRPQAGAASGAPVDTAVAFELRFAQLNVPQRIVPPSRALPPSARGPALERLGVARGLGPRA
jgi:hypothetical protein